MTGKAREHIRFNSWGDYAEEEEISPQMKQRREQAKYNTHLSATEASYLSCLNCVQKLAVSKFLVARDGLQLLQGPPGTGKTHTICSLLKCLTLGRTDRHRTLVSAPSNKATQVVLETFMASLSPEEANRVKISLVGVEEMLPPVEAKGFSRDAFAHHFGANMATKIQRSLTLLDEILRTPGAAVDRLKSVHQEVWHVHERLAARAPQFYSKKLAAKVKPALDLLGSSLVFGSIGSNGMQVRGLLLEAVAILNGGDQSEDERDKLVLEQLNSADVIFATLSVVGRSIMARVERVNSLVVDEVAQSPEADTVVALQMMPERCLLVGDPVQLPSTMMSKAAENAGYGRSVLERLFALNHEHIMLQEQYRMHPAIQEFPSRQFYRGLLSCGGRSGSDQLATPAWCGQAAPFLGPIAFIDVAGQEAGGRGASVYNQAEVSMVAKLLMHLREVSGIDVAKKAVVITFYSAQVFKIRDALRAAKLGGVGVNTVDSFQGSESDIVILSLVRANKDAGIGFVKEYRRYV
ncbi:unnamed protein product [Chrysoparadoxa australica]